MIDLKYVGLSSSTIPFEGQYQNILYITAPKSAFTPNEVYNILKEHNCTLVSFKNSLKIYRINDLEGKEAWQYVGLH